VRAQALTARTAWYPRQRIEAVASALKLKTSGLANNQGELTVEAACRAHLCLCLDPGRVAELVFILRLPAGRIVLSGVDLSHAAHMLHLRDALFIGCGLALALTAWLLRRWQASRVMVASLFYLLHWFPWYLGGAFRAAGDWQSHVPDRIDSWLAIHLLDSGRCASDLLCHRDCHGEFLWQALERGGRINSVTTTEARKNRVWVLTDGGLCSPQLA